MNKHGILLLGDAKYQLHGHVVSNKNTFFFRSFLQYKYSGKTDLEETERTFNSGEQQPETRFYSVCSYTCELMERHG